jgi:HD superfamily phosphodiesterase
MGMTVKELYQQYQIKSNLQQHMMRVAGVAEFICDHISQPIDREEVLNACLLHDMGNIIKFDLTYFPEFLEPEGLAYWQDVKEQFIEKYGKNEHHATMAIAAEVHASTRTLELIDIISFNLEKENYESNDFSRKICAYADMRVAPYGVVSLAERLEDGRKRYEKPGQKNTFGYVMAAFLKKIEVQIF